MRVYANKEQCVKHINEWADDRVEGGVWYRPHYPKPEPMTYDAMPNIPEDVERIVMEMSGHKQEYDRKWSSWFNEQLHHITQSLSIIGQMVNQTRDYNCREGVLEYGRKELKAKLQRDIDRLQKIVDEL
jgi:hypothetical protein